MVQKFGGRKLWQIVANKYFGGQNISGLTALHSKIARIKIVGGLVVNCQSSVLYDIYKFCAIVQYI